MKATQKDFASIAPRAAQAARIFYLCGTDDAGVQDAAHTIASLIREPGERVEFSGAEAKRDPVRLADEARTTSLFGDSRHIWVRCSGDEAHDAVALLLEGDGAPCPVIIQATNASDKSRTAKLLEKRPDALVAMFYPPDLRSVTSAVRGMASAAGLRMADDMAQKLAAAVGLDTRLAASEVTKLALYLDAAPENPRNVTAQDFAAVGAGVEDDGFATLVKAVLGGESARVPQELQRMAEMDLNPVGVILAFERRVAQLVQLAGRMKSGTELRSFMEAERAAHRVFFKDVADITAQLQIWRGVRLERLARRVTQLHRTLIEDNRSALLVLSQALAEIARAAQQARR
jgi:DNA polymerase-3 subunit delta